MSLAPPTCPAAGILQILHIAPLMERIVAEGCNLEASEACIAMRDASRNPPGGSARPFARALVADGVKELNLISQDTTFYGRDLQAPTPVILSEAKDLLAQGHANGWKAEILRFAQNDNSRRRGFRTGSRTCPKT